MTITTIFKRKKTSMNLHLNTVLDFVLAGSGSSSGTGISFIKKDSVSSNM
jgi:hypothetical protein